MRVHAVSKIHPQVKPRLCCKKTLKGAWCSEPVKCRMLSIGFL